jgi:heptosyltransferase III
VRRLLIRPGAIGDFIVSLPALECLRAGDTEVWAPSQLLPLIRFADRTESIASSGLDLFEISGHRPPQLYERLREFDSIVSWYGSRRKEFRRAVEGLPFHFFDALPSGMHATDFYIEQARSLGASGCASEPRIEVRRRVEGFAVIHPFSGSLKKNWPLAHFREVATWLASRCPVNWCAGRDEPLEGVIRIDDLWSLAQWIAGARVYIGNDSGITHLAAATGTPVVAIFEESDPAIWAPRGRAVHILTRPKPQDVIRLLAETYCRKNDA